MGESIAGQNARCLGQRQGAGQRFYGGRRRPLHRPRAMAALDVEAGILYGSATISGQFRPVSGARPPQRTLFDRMKLDGTAL
jgi:hypothetical protein